MPSKKMKCEKCGGEYTPRGFTVHACVPPRKTRKTRRYRVEVPTVGADVYYVDATSEGEAVEKVLDGKVELDHCLDTEVAWDEVVAEEEED